MLRLCFGTVAISAAVAAVNEDWEIVDGAVLSGTEFRNAAISYLGSRDVASVSDCQGLCASNSTCRAFDYVEDISQLSSDLGGLQNKDCWFRLDNTWLIKQSKTRKHTSGRRGSTPTPPSPTPPSPTPAPAPTDAKNVIFIVYDDLRAMSKSYGWSQPHMPNHERLMAESLIFDRAYVQQAVCGPSRASFMSGRRPDRTQSWNFIDGDGAGGWRNAPGADKWNSWPQYFGNNGYYTAGTGKIYHKGNPKNFDPPSWTEPECKQSFPHSQQGDCPVPNELLPRPSPGCPVDVDVYTNCSTGEVNCFPDVTALEKGLEFLHTAATQYKNVGQPFFLAFGFVKPHVPHVYPKKYLDLVPPMEEIDLPPNPEFPEGSPPICWLREHPAGAWNTTADPDHVRSFRQSYYAAAAFSDDLLGQLLDEIEKLGVKDTTAVVVTSDHGWGLGEHNHFVKYTNWETDARVPLYVRVPWKPKMMGQRTSALVEQIDMYPSLAELAGIPVDLSEESVDGRSWAHLVDDPSAEHKSAAYTQYPRCWPEDSQTPEAFTHMERCTHVDKTEFAYMGYSVRTSRWRYTEWAKWDGSTLKPDWSNLAGVELYDHAKDPPENSKVSFEQFENKNVADDFPDVVKQLSTQLHKFVAEEGTSSVTTLV